MRAVTARRGLLFLSSKHWDVHGNGRPCRPYAAPEIYRERPLSQLLAKWWCRWPGLGIRRRLAWTVGNVSDRGCGITLNAGVRT
jgi:hypothetical protein